MVSGIIDALSLLDWCLGLGAEMVFNILHEFGVEEGLERGFRVGVDEGEG